MKYAKNLTIKTTVLTVLLSLLFFKTYSQKPSWTLEVPTLNGYYVGVGKSLKSNPNFQKIALTKALEIISKQIKVNIIAENEYNTYENNSNLEETYYQNTRTKSKIKLTDYELYDKWEDENNYYVYVKLNKEKFRKISETNYNTAISNSKEKITTAEKYLADFEYEKALQFYLGASKFLEEYIDNNLIVEKQSEVLFLWNNISIAILKIFNAYSLKTVKKVYNLRKQNLFNTEFKVQTLINRGKSSKIIADVPVIFEFSNSFNFFEKNTVTSKLPLGISKNKISYLIGNKNKYLVKCRINFRKYLEKYSNYKILKKKSFDLLKVENSFSINITPLKVYVKSRKNNTNSKQFITNHLTAKNIEIVNFKKKADYIINISEKKPRVKYSKDFVFYYITINFTVYKKSKKLFSDYVKVKGVGTNYDTSFINAKENIKNKIDESLGFTILRKMK